MLSPFLRRAAGLTALLCLLGAADEPRAQADCPAESGYQPATGSWCQRSSNYWNTYTADERATCAARSEPQSPINLRPPAEAQYEPLRLVFNYGASQAADFVMMNSGHTVELLLSPEQYGPNGEVSHEPPPGGVPPAPPERTITVSGTRYVLQNAHFHHPSEHLVNGERFPLELHIVHQAGTQRAVVSVLFKLGANNAALDTLFSNMTATAAKDTKVRLAYDALSLWNVLPADGPYMRYEGSLTTPGCDAGVTWFVFRRPVEASQAQIDGFKDAIKTPLGVPADGVPANARQWRESAAEVTLWWAPCISRADRYGAWSECFLPGRSLRFYDGVRTVQ